jgi:hypothetical protein
MGKQKPINFLLITWILAIMGMQLVFIIISEINFLRQYSFQFKDIKWAISILLSLAVSSFGAAFLTMRFHFKQDLRFKKLSLGILSIILIVLIVRGFHFQEGLFVILFESFMTIIIFLELFSFLGLHQHRDWGNIVFFGSLGSFSCYYGWSSLILRRSGWGVNYAQEMSLFALITSLIVVFANLMRAATSEKK